MATILQTADQRAQAAKQAPGQTIAAIVHVSAEDQIKAFAAVRGADPVAAAKFYAQCPHDGQDENPTLILTRARPAVVAE